jgi:hypothetical protein
MPPLRRVLTYFQSFLIIPAAGAAYLAAVTLPAEAGTTVDQPTGSPSGSRSAGW